MTTTFYNGCIVMDPVPDEVARLLRPYLNDSLPAHVRGAANVRLRMSVAIDIVSESPSRAVVDTPSDVLVSSTHSWRRSQPKKPPRLLPGPYALGISGDQDRPIVVVLAGGGEKMSIPELEIRQFFYELSQLSPGVPMPYEMVCRIFKRGRESRGSEGTCSAVSGRGAAQTVISRLRGRLRQVGLNPDELFDNEPTLGYRLVCRVAGCGEPHLVYTDKIVHLQDRQSLCANHEASSAVEDEAEDDSPS